MPLVRTSRIHGIHSSSFSINVRILFVLYAYNVNCRVKNEAVLAVDFWFRSYARRAEGRRDSVTYCGDGKCTWEGDKRAREKDCIWPLPPTRSSHFGLHSFEIRIGEKCIRVWLVASSVHPNVRRSRQVYRFQFHSSTVGRAILLAASNRRQYITIGSFWDRFNW